jgi:protein gp37
VSSNSSIEWTEASWNPVTGCSKVSPGCRLCYAERMSKRLQAMGVENYRDGFSVRLHDATLELPRKWKKPRRIFVNSMSDLLHEDVPLDFILRAFEVMNDTPQHTYQILTKRSQRLKEVDHHLPWSENIWMGVSVENREYTHRIGDLLETRAAVKFLSIEPLLGPVGRLRLKGIDWVIVGGESGPKCRPVDGAWITSIRDQCVRARVPFFFKQWGGVRKKINSRLLEGRTWDEMPEQPHCHGA